MNRKDIYISLIYELTAVATFVCVAVMVLYLLSRRQKPAVLIRSLIFAYCMSGFGWICMIFYVTLPFLFVVLQSFLYFAFLIWHVTLYRIVFVLTATGKKEKFPHWHYLLPVLIPAILFIWSFFVPVDVQVYLVESRGKIVPDYEIFSMLFLSKASVFFIWNLVYALLSLRRILIYRRVVPDYSADEGRSSARWMMQFFWLKMSIITVPFFAFIFGKKVLAEWFVMAIPCLLIIIQLILLCYNIVAENYTIIQPVHPNEQTARKSCKISRTQLENYMATRKPYLNPKLHIADVAADLHSNRTYLSNFINTEYDMNFSRWVNRHRLQELDRIRFDPAYRKLNGMELVMQAGFSNYRGYMRVKREEDRLTTVGE